MNPFYFGRSERPLFGVYSHGRPNADVSHSVLLCYPVGSEYMRAHRAFRQLNTLLNRAGMNVLRFDYSCTGDSGGDGIESSVEAWLDDVDWALDELKDNADTETVSVAGLRLGATLATRASAIRDDVDHLLLWDPIVSGSDYLDAVLGSPRPTETTGVEGFPVTVQLQKEIDGIDLTSPLEGLSDLPVSILVSEAQAEYERAAQALAGQGAKVHHEVVPSEGNWAQADPFGDALIPQQIIQAIVERLQTGPAS